MPNCPTCAAINRRRFLRSLLPGAMAFSVLAAAQPAKAEKIPKALILTCIDYRMLESERYFLSLQNLGGQYDWTALAGGAFALTGYPHKADAEAFWDQLEISTRVHHIQKVILIDHQDCGAYATGVDANLTKDPVREQEVHTKYLSQAYWAIRDRYPDLNIELYFATLKAEMKSILPLSRS